MENTQIISNGADVRRTAAEMFPLIEAQLESGKSQKVFCDERGLSLCVFSYWRRKYREQKTGPAGFIQVSRPENFAAIRLTLDSGHLLELESSVSATWLAELISKLS